MQTTRSHFDSGKTLFDEGNFIDARDELEMHVSKHAQDDEALHLLAMACYRLKLYGEAIDCFNRIIARNPGVHTLHTNLGMAHLKNSQVDLAVTAFKRSLDLNPDQPNTQRYLSLAETAIRMKGGNSGPESVQIETGATKAAPMEPPKKAEPPKAAKPPVEAPKLAPTQPAPLPKAEPPARATPAPAPAKAVVPTPVPPPPPPAKPASAGPKVDEELIKTAEEIEAEVDNWEPGDPMPVEPAPKVEGKPVIQAVGHAAKAAPPKPPAPKVADLDSIEIPIETMVMPDPEVKATPIVLAPPPAPEQELADATALEMSFSPTPEPMDAAPGAGNVRALLTLSAHTRSVQLAEDKEPIQWIESNLIRLRLVKDRTIFSRTSAIVSTQGDLKFEPIYKKWKGKRTTVLFGTASDPIMQITGQGEVLLNDEFRSVFRIEEEVLYTTEESVSAFDGAVKFENGSLQTGGADINLVQFKGRGVVALRGNAPFKAIGVKNGVPQLMDPQVIVGWYGKLMPAPKAVEISPGKTMNLLELRGDGQVLFRCRPAKNG